MLRAEGIEFTYRESTKEPLSEAEIRVLRAAFGEIGPIMGPMFKLRLLTAQRGGEVISMRWHDIDLAARSWTIPAEVAKYGLAHTVPLSDDAVALLNPLLARDDAALAVQRRRLP